MIKVLFACSAGMSTSLLVSKVKTLASEKGIDLQVEAVGEAEVRKRELDIDVLLLGPQVRYLEKQMKDLVAGKNIQVGVVDMRAYGTMNAEKVLEQIQAMHAQKA